MTGTWWPLWFKFSAKSKYHAVAERPLWTFCSMWAGEEKSVYAKSAYAEDGHPPEKKRCKTCYKELIRRFQTDDDWSSMHPEWRPEELIGVYKQARMHFSEKPEPAPASEQ